MAVHKSAANSGSKTHYSKPTSKLSKHNAYTTPESREIGTKLGSVEKAHSALRKVHY